MPKSIEMLFTVGTEIIFLILAVILGFMVTIDKINKYKQKLNCYRGYLFRWSLGIR